MEAPRFHHPFTLCPHEGVYFAGTYRNIFLSGCAERLNIEGAKLATQSPQSFVDGDATYELSQQIPAEAITLVVEYVDALNYALDTGDLRRFNKSAKVHAHV